MKKITIFLIILAAVFFTSTLVLLYLNLNLNKNIPITVTQEIGVTSPKIIIPTTVPSPDPTANWKTYTSVKYNYQLKYPQNWSMDEACGDQRVNCIGTEATLRSPDSIYPDGEFTIEILDSTCNGFAIQSWGKPVTKSKTIVDGKEGLLIIGKLDWNDSKLHDVKNICIPVGNKGYLFKMWSLNKPEEIKKFNQILSTFKFTP